MRYRRLARLSHLSSTAVAGKRTLARCPRCAALHIGFGGRLDLVPTMPAALSGARIARQRLVDALATDIGEIGRTRAAT